MPIVAPASCHQTPRVSSIRASSIMTPQLGCPCTPRPRNDRITSALIADMNWIDMLMITKCDTLGRICLKIREKWEAPRLSAATT